VWRSIQHNNTTPLSRFCFFCTSILGKQGQICFAEFLKIISSFFAQNFCTDRVDIRLCSATNKKEVTVEIWRLLSPRSIVGVGDKHSHDSDHAECNCVITVDHIGLTYTLSNGWQFPIYPIQYSFNIKLTERKLTNRWQARREPQRGPGKHYRGALSPLFCLSWDRDAEDVKRRKCIGEMSPHHPTSGSWERYKLPQRGPGRSPGRKWKLCIF